MKFNERFKDIRTDHDITQAQMGKILNMTQRKISRLEKGETEPTTDEIVLICKTFKIDANWILGLKN